MAKEKKQKAEKETKKAEAQHPRHEAGIPPRLRELFKETVTKDLMKQFQYKNVMQVPRLDKISINVGVGIATQDAKLLDAVVKDLETIVGQKVVTTRAKKAISNFKLREGLAIGARVTLRRAQMYEFMDRFISVAVPRIRDFKGFSDRSFDGRGNYTIGIKEHIIFPEIDVDKVTKVFGMDISFVTTAGTDQEAYELLKGLGMPFVKRQEILEQASVQKN
jgi:large subunit ribosomal protein L5